MAPRMGSSGTEIVIDVGCATHGADRSVEPLVDRFHPEKLYGFDPQVHPCEFDLDGTKVKLDNAAAWVSGGRLRFDGHGLGARFVEKGGRYVRCIDLPKFIANLPTGAVLKLDAEGSEWQLLRRLIDLRLDATLGLVLVEWHCYDCGHGIWSHAASCESMDTMEQEALEIEAQLACPHERWEL